MRPFKRILLMLATLVPGTAVAQLDFEKEPIRYSESQASDPITRLAAKVRDESVTLKWEAEHGYLESLLQELDISASSQTLVFSKTSLQVGRISPARPRAIYFNDDVYVGWVQHGDVIELSAADAQLGGTFYTLDQDPDEGVPLLQRETSRCLQCHGSTHTRRIPGHIVRSVYPDRTGQPVFRLGTHLTNDASPFSERWGGWYVTGTHGDQRHMGNVWLENPDEVEELDPISGQNVTDLTSLISTEPYLTPHSDIVALMVLQHQVAVHNVLTAANHSGRLTARDAVVMNKALDRPVNFESDSTARRYQSAADKVVKAILFADAAALTAPVIGTSSFAEEFSRRGPFDQCGRSLRQLNLKTRLFEWPCSYLIYSEAFRSLPAGVAQRVERRLADLLDESGQTDVEPRTSGRDDFVDSFQHLTPRLRREIKQILLETTDLNLNR